MEADIKITEALINQHELLSELGRQTYIDQFESIWDQEGLEKFLNASFNSKKLKSELKETTKFKHFLVYQNETILGYASLRLYRFLPGLKDADSALIEKIYLNNNSIGKGLGSLLMNHIITFLSNMNKEYVWLEVLDNNERAKKFYSRHGFEIHRQRPFNNGKIQTEIIIMKKRLT